MEIYSIITKGFQENTYIFAQDEKALIVDPGGDFDRIVQVIESQDLEPKLILLTHGHGDHIGAVNQLRDKYNIKAYAHRLEKELLEDMDLNVSKMLGNPVIVKADGFFEDEDIIEFEGNNIKVIHTPGHTMGGVCFYFDDILVSGDTLFRGSVGRSDLATGNMSQLMDSLNNRLMKLPDETKVLPGHGPRSTIVFERENNPYIGWYLYNSIVEYTLD